MMHGFAGQMEEAVSYQTYLDLNRLLTFRMTFTDSLVEHSFIMAHQAAELYIDDTNRYLESAKKSLKLDKVVHACEALRIVAANIHNGWMVPWTRLLDMRPQDFQLIVRPHLSSASGFQSVGHRIFEFHQGAKTIDVSAGSKGVQRCPEKLMRLRDEPSVYDEAIAALARRGFAIDKAHLDRDKSQPYEASASVEQAWLKIYADAEEFRDLYELGERLIDIDHKFQIWRFCHLKTVQRHIGRKKGTHGTSGVSYLASLVGKEFYPELWSLRNSLADINP